MGADWAVLGCSTHQHELGLGTSWARPGCRIWSQRPRQGMIYTSLGWSNHWHMQDLWLEAGLVMELRWCPGVLPLSQVSTRAIMDVSIWAGWCVIFLNMRVDWIWGVPCWARLQHILVLTKASAYMNHSRCRFIAVCHISWQTVRH